MRILVLLLVIFNLHFFVYSQQDPQYTQYMYNQNVVNPAYATNNLGIINFGGIHRSQWASAEGAPTTFTFFAHAPVTEKIETGLSIITDNIGDGLLKENNFYADFAYILQLAETHKISLGIKAGLTNFQTDFNGIRLPEIQDDPAFNEDLKGTFPNIGAGAFYFTDKYYVGFSVPNLLKNKHLEERNGINRIGSEEIHFFLTGGYVHEFNPDLKLKPSFMAKAVKGSPPVLDTSMNVLLYNRFEGGISYRINDSFSGMFNVKALPSLTIGYAYDYTTSNLGDFNSGTHEIMVLFDLDLLGLRKGYDKSPRFF
ncbi:PorP/SprF family type IX secretion system membrane protein [Abyssalbus ytuae]|uniref:Type IX secretion system membrane protein PorP/SprF n=1 Tax=Abyssalbus ytuae TaxID=2926907 RepID=A0A9E7CY80_9FLAO|nr:type IX secretion system membrane protein PorP/SprF [Abyssalbus ytuae]UOB16360.1 type IX secretion system membrane protein PorP/SprF [Abyssalbus ytuae]